jgi:hypothetical protein
VQRRLERIARVHRLAVDPCLAVLPVHVVPEQPLVQLEHVRVVGKHDVAGAVEGEALVLDRAAPAADARVLLDQQAVAPRVQGGRQAGGARAEDHGGVQRGPRRAGLRVRGRMPGAALALRPCVDQLDHFARRAVPGGRTQNRGAGLGLRRLVAVACGQRGFACGNEGPGAVGDGHHAGVGARHVADRRAHHRLARGHVLERLGGADVARGLVQLERQQAHVPAGDQLGKLLVAALSQPVDVGPARQRAGVDLDHRAHHHDLPVGMRVGQRGDQREVDALVHHAAVAQARMRNARLVRVVRVVRAAAGRLRGAREMRRVHAARKAVHVFMAVALRLVQALAPGEDEVGNPEQRAFSLQQLARRMPEGGEFVHAVVHHALRRQLGGQRHGHGRVEPQPVVVDGVLAQVRREQGLQLRNVVVVKARRAAGEVRAQHRHALARRQPLQRGARRVGHRLFHEEHRMALRDAREQLLRALVHEIPAQMGKDDQCGHWAS